MINWLIEEKTFEDNIEDLKAAIKRAGQNIINLYYRPFGATNLATHSSPTKDVNIVISSLECAHWVRRSTQYVPGVYYNVPMYECVNYYSTLGKYLLNDNYIMLPWAEMERKKEFLYDKLGQDRAIFVRPNRGDKIFTGQLVYKEKYEDTLKLLGFYDFPKTELVIVAEPQNIKAEWRFVIAREIVITGSRYKENGLVGSDPSYPQGAADFANTVAKEYHPDSVYIIDVGLTKAGDYRLVEVGCFSCAGLYKCNTDIIVEHVSRIAVEDWKEIYEI